MSTEITAAKAFREKMEARIRESIGELMPDDALAEMVREAMHKAFFEEREVEEGDGWRTRKVKVESWMVTICRDLLREQVDAAVKVWLAEHQQDVQALVAEQVAKGFSAMAISAINMAFGNALSQCEVRIADTLQRLAGGQ